jgi:hypothetical protein
MRAHEFIKEDASASSSCAGSMAVVVQPMGTISRSSASLQNGKNTINLTPDSNSNKKEFKKKFKFQNSL